MNICPAICSYRLRQTVGKRNGFDLPDYIHSGHTTIGLCAGVALEFLPLVAAARLFNEVKY